MAERMSVDEAVERYAGEADRIYRNRTAGDFTWIGLLSEFLMALDAEDQVAKTVEVTETDVNRLAQLFYEESGPGVRMIPMTAKPDIVNGLNAVLAKIGVKVVPG